MSGRIAEINVDGLGVANVKDTIGLWRKPSPHLSLGPDQVRFQPRHGRLGHHIAVRLVVLPRLVQVELVSHEFANGGGSIAFNLVVDEKEKQIVKNS
jgi:hypothetical protein